MMRWGLLIVLLAALVLCGCESVAEVGTQIAQDAGLITEDEGHSIRRSAQALQKTQEDLTPEQEYYIGRAVAAQVFQSYRPLGNPQANAYLNLLGQSLAVFSECPETFGGYHFLLLDSDEVNAFAAPGGLILVSRGMLSCCESEDELAAVLAHEISHVQCRHGLAAIKQSRLTEAFTIIAAESAKQFGSDDLADLTREFEGCVSDVVMTLTTSGYSRDQEREADADAVALLQRAGYPRAAMITMLHRMDQRLAHAGGLGFAKTHPPASERAQALQARGVGAQSATNATRQARFVSAVGSMSGI